MTMPLFSTAYLPPISMVAAMSRYPEVLIEATETFPKQTYRNRTLIMTAGGVRPLSVPTLRNNHSRTEEVGVDYSTRWATVHLRTLQAAYAASPYWEYYSPELRQLLEPEYPRLIDLNRALSEWLLAKLKVGCHMTFTTDFVPPNGEVWDYRYCFSPKLPPRTMPKYYQVFAATQPFVADLSSLDLLMNLGPEAAHYLQNVAKQHFPSPTLPLG